MADLVRSVAESTSSNSLFGMANRWFDRWIPAEVLGTSIDAKRRARALVIAVALMVVVALLSAARDACFGRFVRAFFCLAATIPLGLTLFLLRKSLSVCWSSHYLLLVATFALLTRPLMDPEGSQLVIALCGLGFVAAHQISERAGVLWTLLSIGLATSNAIRLGAFGSPEAEVAWTIPILAGAIGIASVAVEYNRHVAVDIATDAKLQAHEGRERLRILAERAFPGIIDVSPGEMNYASAGVKELLGYDADEFKTRGLQEYVHPDDFWPVVKELHADPDRVAQVEARLRHARGHWTWIAAFAIPHPARPTDDRWIFAARDVESERRERERGVQAERLEGVALLAAGVAHDFNNLLTVIGGNAEMLDVGGERDHILQATDEAARLTRQLLAFGKEQPHELRNFELRELVEELAPILKSLVGEEIALRIDSDDNPCAVRADPAQLNQVVLNLVTNARDATPAGGVIEIEISQGSISQREASECGLESGEIVQLLVRDDGIGMDANTILHAFDPFFTTKTGGRGNGLGLSSAYGITRQIGGHLQLESAPGEGTVVILRLPHVTESEPLVHPPGRLRPDAVECGPIIVVEDDPRIRSIASNALRASGFDTLEAEDGQTALRMFREANPLPSLLVTDVVMPGMRGPVVAKIMRQELPGLKILFISGYSDQELGGWQEADEDVAFLAKPFTPTQLTDRVGELLTPTA